MSKKILKCLWGIFKYLLLALYAFIFYEMLVVPAVLDWSLYGVLLVAGLTVLLVYAVPKDQRRSTAVLTVVFILALQAMENISSYPVLKKSLNILFICLVLLITGKLLGKFKIRQFFVVFLTALVLNLSLDLSQAPMWTEFTVQWESPQLYKRFATADYFPVKLADLDGDGTQEIITQENIPQAEKETAEFVKKGTHYQIMEPETYHYAVFKWNGNIFSKLSPEQYDVDKLLKQLPIDYVGYPFYKIEFTVDKTDGITQKMTPLLDRAELVEKGTNIAAMPFTMLKLNQLSLSGMLNSEKELNMPESTRIVARGKLLPNEGEQVITLDDKLKVWASEPGGQLLAEIDKNQVSDIGTSEVHIGDVDKDHVDEIILTSEVARILKLTPEGKWDILWSSPEQMDAKARFQKFRFEDFAPLGKDQEPQIIALSKSNVRNNPTRYMTGYKYEDGTLVQTWRVFSGLINLRAGDVDGDGKNELIGYMYRAQRLFVLKKHDLPIVPAIYTLTGGLILLGFGLQLKKRSQMRGGSQNA